MCKKIIYQGIEIDKSYLEELADDLLTDNEAILMWQMLNDYKNSKNSFTTYDEVINLMRWGIGKHGDIYRKYRLSALNLMNRLKKKQIATENRTSKLFSDIKLKHYITNKIEDEQ